MFGLSTEFIKYFGHCKEIRVLTFGALTLRQSESNSEVLKANSTTGKYCPAFS